MRVAWSRIPRAPFLFFLLFLLVPAWFDREAGYANAAGITVLMGMLTVVVWHLERVVTPENTATLDVWREQVGNRDTRQGCTSLTVLTAALAPCWMFGWWLSDQLDFSVWFLKAITAIAIFAVHYVSVVMCIAFVLDTRPPAVPPHLRDAAASRPRALGVAGAGDAREIAPGFVADLSPDGPPAPATGVAAAPAAPLAPLKRVLRVPQVAAWKPASERRLRVREWRAVLGLRFALGFTIVLGMIAGAAWLGAWRGGGLAVLAAVVVIVAAVAQATRWEWPGEVSLADWFRSERSLVNAQKGLGSLSSALVIGSGLVIAGEAVWARASGTHDLFCGAPLVMIAASVAFPLAWRWTLRRSIGQPPAVRSVPEPIRQAVLAVARRREEVVSRSAESEEVSVVEDLAGVPVAPVSAEPAPPRPMAPVVAEGGPLARETHERILAELSRASSLRADGPQLVRRVEQRLANPGPKPDDTDLLVEVAELLFLAFPDRAASLVSALGDALAAPAPPNPPAT